ncbi:hypothetical protein [Embleya sp. NPDC005575]|uniref:hypothetical protein n=1 Tax=Embleya sp. NPDC005575 TaxID=3156892 RepID=UPI0033A42CAD
MRRIRHITRRVTAGCATVIIVATTGLVAASGPATAAEVAFPERCHLVGPSSPPWATDEIKVDLTVFPEKAVYSAGEQVTVTWHWRTRPSIPVPPRAATLRAIAEVRVGGTRSTTFTAYGQPRPQPAGPEATVDLWDLQGTLRLPASGPITLTPGAYSLTEGLSTVPMVQCAPTTPPAVSRTLEIGPGPTLSATPTHVVPGDRIEFTGEGWPEGEARVQVCGTPTGGCPPEWASSATGSARAGRLTGSVTLSEAPRSVPLPPPGHTVFLLVSVGASGASRELTLMREGSPQTGGTQITGSVHPGGLTLHQQASAIKLSDITLDGTAQSMTGALNPVTVTDVRGGSLGWALTADISDFTSPEGGRIPADRFIWKPSVQADPASPSTAAPGTPGRIAGGSTLASAPPAPRTGGTFTAGAAITVALPAYQKPGTYSATLTLSIS